MKQVAIGAAVAFVFAGLAPFAAFFVLVGTAGGLIADVEEKGLQIPAYLEAAYRQVATDTGRDWSLLAAWDGADNQFVLPIPTQAEIYSELVREAERRREERAEEECRELPPDAPCPGPEPLSEDDLERLAREAARRWYVGLLAYIRSHADQITADDEADPEALYDRVLSRAKAEQAAELQMAYALLDLDYDDDHIIEYPGDGPPSDWTPVDGFAWPAEGTITSRYGWRTSPIDGQRRLHAGIDLGLNEGLPIRASRDGVVIRAESDEVYGLVVVIDHGEGYRSLYAHSSRLAVVAGARVVQGQEIARSGSTGWSTGPHLHFEIHYQGAPVDPLLLLGR